MVLRISLRGSPFYSTSLLPEAVSDVSCCLFQWCYYDNRGVPAWGFTILRDGACPLVAPRVTLTSFYRRTQSLLTCATRIRIALQVQLVACAVCAIILTFVYAYYIVQYLCAVCCSLYPRVIPSVKAACNFRCTFR